MSQSELKCIKCDQIHSKCTAHNRQGNPCGRKPCAYQTVCDMHGGSSPRALRAAARREVAAVVTHAYDADPDAILAAQGMEPVADPLGELGRLAAQSTAFMDALGARVNALEDVSTTSKLGVEALRVEIALYERAMDRTARLLKLLVDSGFEQRRLELDEQTAGLFVTAMRQVLARLDLTPEQNLLVGTVVPEVLRGLDA